MTKIAQELVILVDEHDNPIGTEEKMRAHELGLLHRAFSVFIFRKGRHNIELLLQQRQRDKYHCGGMWTNTCCSHPRLGESVLEAAQRRLQEEMGFNTKLQTIGAFMYRAEFNNGLIEHEYDYALIGTWDGQQINFNPDEVQDYQWVTLTELELRMQTHPAVFTPWLGGALAIVKDNWSHVENLLSKEQVLQ